MGWVNVVSDPTVVLPVVPGVPDQVLVVGGSGMLAPCVNALLASGRTVVLASRHSTAFRPSASSAGLVAVRTDWSDPEVFATTIEHAAAGIHVGAIVLWVHLPYRNLIAAALDEVLPAGSPMVRLWGTGSGRPFDDSRAAGRLARRPVHEVYLGHVETPRGRRWLTHTEISRGALKALGGGPRELEIGVVPR